jgi:hypothetical protein
MPPLPGPPTLIKANGVSPVGNSLAEIIGIDLTKGYQGNALKVTEKGLLKKKLSKEFQFTANEGHFFGKRSVAKRCAKNHAKSKCERRSLFK